MTETYPSQEYWECLYNHKRICEAIVHEGAAVAKILFRQQVQRLVALSGDSISNETETAYILLTSLNRSLYNYILFHLNLSLAPCCFQCRAHTHAVHNAATVIASGETIIDQYSLCLNESEKRYQHIERACAYIQEHLHEELSIALLCEHTYLSKSYLCKAFKELTGSTFSDYVRQQRLIRARMLLVSTAESIDEIASRCGFSSSTYFSTVFKREMGMNPSAFRQEFANLARGKAIVHTPGMSFTVE